MSSAEWMAAFIYAAVIAVTVAGIWILLVRMPRWTRPELYFAVTIDPAFRSTPEAVAIERRYRRRVAAHSLIALVLAAGAPALAAAWPNALVLFSLPLAGLLWQSVGSMAAVAMARHEVLPHAVAAVTTREVRLERRPMALAGGWGWLAPAMLLLASAAWLALRWRDIPDRFPTHWGPSGRPDAWGTREPLAVFTLHITGLLTWLTLLGLAAATGRFSRRIYARGRGAGGEGRFLRLTQWILLGTALWSSLLMATLGLLPLKVQPDSPMPGWIWGLIVLELVLAVVVIAVLARAGQGGWRMAADEAAGQAGGGSVGDRTPDVAWKLGLFYYNPDDPALFVEKRFGIGYDVNWARPAVWIGLLVLLLSTTVVPLALVFLAGQDRLVPGEPVVAETSPAHGDWDVDPGLREIRIRFDQPMDTSAWSVSGSTHYPEVTGEPYWADDRTFVLPVRVEPGRTYEVHINRAGGPRFRNAHGRAAPSAVIDFQTRAVR